MPKKQITTSVEIDTYSVQVFMLFTLVADALVQEGKQEQAIAFLAEAYEENSLDGIKKVAGKYVTLTDRA